MITRKKAIIITIFTAVLAAIITGGIVRACYDPDEQEKKTFCGTYQLDSENADDAIYFALIYEDRDAGQEESGTFVQYDSNGRENCEGIYQVGEEGRYATLYISGQLVGTLFCDRNQYYWIADGEEVKTIMKTSEEPFTWEESTIHP